MFIQSKMCRAFVTLVYAGSMVVVPACTKTPPQGTQAHDQVPMYYRNPMDPLVTSPVPMKDKMGMDYVPVYAHQHDDAVVVTAEVQQALGVRTTKVLYAP